MRTGYTPSDNMLKYMIYLWIFVWTLISKCPQVYSQSSEDFDCDPPWEKLHRTCVQFMKAKPFVTWPEARNSCISMNSDLLSINDREENKKILPLVKQHVNSFDLLKWWIGIRQDGSHWSWVDNDEAYARIPEWGPNSGRSVNPSDNSLHEGKCGLLDYRGYLSDVDCDTEERPYICEQFKITTDSTTSQSTTTTTTPKTTTTTTAKSTATSYPVPTPQTGTPNTRPPVTQYTEEPEDKSTHKPTEKTTEEQTTKRQIDKPTAATTTTQVTGYSTDKTTGKTTAKETTARPTDRPTETSTEKPVTGTPTDKPTRKPTDTPVTDKSTRKPSTGRPTDARPTTTKKPNEEKDEFLGCFAVNHESTCPPVEAFGISWPRSVPGKPVKVPCDKGHAKWYCDKNPTCWRDEPDVKQCTSESIQELTTQMEVFLSNTSNSEKAVEFTENLAASVESDKVMSEQDIFQSTKLMNAASNAKPKNSTEAKNIIKNVAKCGSLLVGKDQKNTWSSMNKESQRTVASSLLTSMESVTSQMLQSFEEPTVEKIVEENMAIELQVIEINKEGPDVADAVFQEETNSFAIPQENLKRFSTGGLARLVFINYNTVGELLVPDDDVEGDSLERQMISQVISASLNEKPIEEPLIKPVIFTMKTEKRAKSQEWKQLCSFWNFSLGYTGAWSQRGCSLKKYNDSHTTCQCNHLTNFAILMDIHSTKLTPIHATTLSYITYVGIIISIICLFLSWITFICLSSAQGERNSIHKNLVFCLFIAEVLFLAGIERTDNKIACAIIAGFLHYFFLSSFTWMFVEGIHILFMLVQVFDAAKSRLKYYYAIGYGVPLITVGVSALVYYEGYGTERYCWLTTDRMFIWSFAGPVAFILLVNLIVLMYAMSAVCKHSEYVFTKEKSSVGNIKLLAIPAFAQQMQKRMRKHQAWIQGALALEVLLGLTWVFGYFYISEEAIPMAYLFTIFNSLQGLFIFLFHCILNKKVRKEYVRFIDYPRRPVTSGTNSSKGTHHSGSGPTTSSYHMNGTRKHSGGFVNLSKDRRSSSKSTTSA